ncbi:MAG: adenosylcobinamide amidohydrolase [Methanomassiliicoccus sp.]|nr:adenosylcobinamide amidohydrolase [Methanomassiliicoccus sp.]
MTVGVWQKALAQEVLEPEKRLVCRFLSGESVFRHGRALIVQLPEGRNTLITSWLNGGYREDLRAVFNSQTIDDVHGHLKIEEYSLYLKVMAERLGLDPERTSGLSTAVHMDNASIVTKSYQSTSVTAIVTGGVEGNGGRAGDPASYNEVRGVEPIGGTIVTMLLVNGDMPKHTMARAIMTATEAKSCALQQLMAPSRYSTGIATGSGTDQIAIISDRDSSNRLTDAGKHSKLGELIGKCVIEATTEALNKHGGLNPASQRDAMVRLKRYRINENDCWTASAQFPGNIGEAEFRSSLRNLSREPEMVAAIGSILHIVDEVSWGLIPEEEGNRFGNNMIARLPQILRAGPEGDSKLMINEASPILANLVSGLAQMVKEGGARE